MAGRPVVSTGLSWQQWRDPEAVIVCGLGSGFLPRAPGTCGSLVAVLMWWAVLVPLGWVGQLFVIGAVTALGIWLVGRVQARYGVDDAGAIVIDEFVGQWIVLLGAPAHAAVAALGFLLFRLFDIAKPWPIRQIERRFVGAVGVMVDDLAAGILGCGVLQVTLWACSAI